MLATVCVALTLGATPAELNGFDVRGLDYAVVLDPTTGVASGSIAIEVHASTAARQIILSLDAGLAITAATLRDNPERSNTVVDEDAAPLHIVRLTLDEPVPVGATRVIDVSYSGTLACSTSDIQGHRACRHGAGLGYLRRESVLPNVFDAADVVAYELYRRSLTLTLPSGLDAIASADVVSETSAAGRTTRIYSGRSPDGSRHS